MASAGDGLSKGSSGTMDQSEKETLAALFSRLAKQAQEM
jgi:hypothetical protein